MSGRDLNLPIVFAALICVAAMSAIVPVRAIAQSKDFSKFLQQLKPEELNKTVDGLATNVPMSMLAEDEKKFANEMIEAGKTARNYGQQLHKGKSGEVGRALGQSLANATKDELISQLKKRFPDSDSPVREILSSVENDTDAWRDGVKAVLGVDPNSALVALGQTLTAKGAEKYNALVEQGKKFWKNKAEGLIPGSSRLKKMGIGLGDVYLGGVENFAEFVKARKRSKDNRVFDCLHRRYRAAAAIHGKHAARDEVESNGLRGFNCLAAINANLPALSETDQERENKGLMRDLAGLYRRGKETAESLMNETTTLAESGKSLKEIVDLIEVFEEPGTRNDISGTRLVGGFADWAQKRIRGTKAPPRPVRPTISWWTSTGFGFPLAQLQNWTGEKAASLKRILDALQEILEGAIGRKRLTELTGVPLHEDYLPKGEVKSFAKGLEEEKKAEQKRKDDEKNPEKVARKVERDLECNPKHRTTKSALDDEFTIRAPTADKGPEFVDEKDCTPYGEKQTVLQYEVPEPLAAPTKSKSDPETVHCAALNERVNKAVARFNEGEIKPAGSDLKEVMSDLAALSDSSACSDVRRRATSNTAKLGGIIKILGEVENALTHCEPGALEQQERFLEDASNQKLKALYNRVKRAKPVASKYTLAKAAFRSGNLKESESLFRQSLSRARHNRALTCDNIEDRIGSNLQRINTLQDIEKATTVALGNCNMTRVAGLKSDLKGSTNPFLDRVYARLSNIPQKCKQKIGDASCQEDFGAHARVNLARSNDKTYSCTCRPGYKWRPGASGSNRACIPAAEANRILSKGKPKPAARPTSGNWTPNSKCRQLLANFGSLKRIAAVAVAKNGRCGFGYGWKTRSQAVGRALAECRKRGSGCRIVR